MRVQLEYPVQFWSQNHRKDVELVGRETTRRGPHAGCKVHNKFIIVVYAELPGLQTDSKELKSPTLPKRVIHHWNTPGRNNQRTTDLL